MSGDNRPDGLRSFETPPGGILTREVGAITGEVEIRTSWAGTHAVAEVRYVDADEWYTVAGLPGSMIPFEVMQHLAADPGVDADGNPVPSRL